MEALGLAAFLKTQAGASGLLLIRLGNAGDSKNPWSKEDQVWNNAWWKTRSHPIVEDLDLPERQVAIDSRAGQELRELKGWGREPRWVLVDATGQIHGSGTEIPTPEELVRVIRATGFRSRYEQVATFLHEHPDHPEALRGFLPLALSRAQRSQRRFDEPIRVAKQRRAEVEGLAKDSAQVALLRNPAMFEKKIAELCQKYGPAIEALVRQRYPEMMAMLAEYEHPPELPPVQEAPEWAEVAKTLTTLLDQPDWAANSYSGSNFRVDTDPQSLTFQRAAQEALPKVEALLLRCPTSYTVWEMWQNLLQASGVFNLEVLDQIQRPGCPDGPPGHFSSKLENVLKMAGRWAELRPRLLSRWEDWLTEKSSERSGNFSEFDPLIAADLHLGFNREAESRLEALLKAFGEDSAPWILSSASSIATECGQKELSEAWGQRSQALLRARMERANKGKAVGSHTSLCNCSWNLTGNWSAMIFSASQRISSLPQTGLNKISNRSKSPRSAHQALDHS